MTLKVTILGCGSSGGVPRVGNIWGEMRSGKSEEQPPTLFDIRGTGKP
jgi:phosphoribosyl 1,2-cyclic phosphate phosphodiesterase